MATTPNGFAVIDRIEDCQMFPIKTGLTLPLRPGDCGYALAYFLKTFDKQVEPLGLTTTFGWAHRQNTNSPGEWSEHAGGVAVDANSTEHPNGREDTFSTTELLAIRRIQEDFDGIINWGGDFRSTKDEMHFQLDGTLDEINLVVRRLKKDNTVSLKRLKPGNRNIDVYMVKRVLQKRGYFAGPMNLYFSTALRKAYKEWEEDQGNFNGDGIPGKNSLEALGFKVVKE